ncbi:hypothetical protein Tco_1455941 [Tanacetum coccineum]
MVKWNLCRSLKLRETCQSGLVGRYTEDENELLVMVDVARGSRLGAWLRIKPLDEDDDVVVLENSKTEEEDVKEDESDHNKERYTFKDDDDDSEFDDLD